MGRRGLWRRQSEQKKKKRKMTRRKQKLSVIGSRRSCCGCFGIALGTSPKQCCFFSRKEKSSLRLITLPSFDPTLLEWSAIYKKMCSKLCLFGSSWLELIGDTWWRTVMVQALCFGTCRQSANTPDWLKKKKNQQTKTEQVWGRRGVKARQSGWRAKAMIQQR